MSWTSPLPIREHDSSILRRPCRRMSVLLAALAVAVLGCTDAEDESDEGSDAPGTAAEDPAAPEGGDAPSGAASDLDRIPELVREVAPSTVAIEISASQGGQVVQGGGSGVIWDADGIVVTNNHVAEPADEMAVVLADGARHDAELVAGDPRTDIAVLRIDATGLPAATFSEDLPDIGEIAVALGNPLGFQNTATFGIVSGVDRSLPVMPNQAPLVGLIQTDAAISSGNSGGALIDRNGEVVGINVAAVGDAQVQGVAQGLGFAIPADTVVAVVEQLLEDGEVAHAYLGIRGANLTPQLAQRFDLDRERGVLIGQVEPGGPADEAGLEQGQVIVSIDGTDIETLSDLFAVLQRADPEDVISVTVAETDGEETTTDVTLIERPDEVS